MYTCTKKQSLKIHEENTDKIGWRKDDAGKDWEQEDKVAEKNEMVGWYHQLNGNESEHTPRDSEGQKSLVWCSQWVRKEPHMT